MKYDRIGLDFLIMRSDFNLIISFDIYR